MNLKILPMLMAIALVLPKGADAAESELIDRFINAPLSAVWQILTTAEGYKSTGVNQADVDLRIGGHIRTHAGPGTLGDSETLDREILAFDPQHMLALRVAHAPSSWPHQSAFAGTWTVIYFDNAGENMTRVRVIGLGFTDAPESQALRSYLETADRQMLDRAAKPYWPKCAHCQLESPLPPER